MQAIIMIGLPGSGKTTVADELILQGFQSLSADRIREELYGDAGIQGDGAEVWGLLYTRLAALVAGKSKVLIDNTSVKSRDRKKLLEFFIPAGYTTEYWLIDTPLEECLQRNSKRERFVPEEVILKMAKTLQENRAQLAHEGPVLITIKGSTK